MGLYAFSRNPRYLGHLVFLSGLSLTLKSWFAAVITLAVAIWFHFRVLADEASLARQLGAPCIAYTEAEFEKSGRLYLRMCDCKTWP